MKFSTLLLTTVCLNGLLAQSSSQNKKYIIKFKDDLTGLNIKQAIDSTIGSLSSILIGNAEVANVYEHVFSGYAAHFPDKAIPILRSLPIIDSVEEDSIMYANDLQQNAPWGLARISQREPISSNTTVYRHNANGGDGVSVYIIDSGVRTTHQEFENRAVFGKSFIKGNDISDENGHGTHVAGTVAGKTYGVAKKAQIIAIKIFDASGSGKTSDIISGIDWAVKDKRGKNGNVINMSLGGSLSMSLNIAVERANKKGFVVAVAAGNSNQDACLFSPASAFSAITVGATNITDYRAYFSNYGACVDFFAPGQAIKSSWNGSDTDTKIISGTSMASPHVAGLAAYFLSQEPLLTPSQVANKIKSLVTEDAIKGVGLLSPNYLIFNGEVN